jgi:Tfp pilus assembly protein PilF/4-amino-4-deoxy-L-arabinose transferase-like glycosyltransferase
MRRRSRRVVAAAEPLGDRRPSRWADCAPAAVVFATALALRIAAVSVLGPLPLSRSPQLDSREYLLWAQHLAERGFVWPEYPEHAPGYSFFLGVLLWMFDGSLTVVRVVQALLASICCVFTARVAARTLTPKAYLPAGLLQALYAPLVYLDTAILAEPLFVFLLMWSLDLVTSAADRRRRWLLAGLLVGLASVTRPTGLVVLAAYAAVFLWDRRFKSTSWRPLTTMMLGAALAITPVVVQNWRVTGVPLIQAYGGLNLYLGNTPSSDGGARARPGEQWDRLEGEASRHGTTRNDQDRYFVQKTLSEIVANPIGYARLLASKLSWSLQNEELRDTHSYYFFREAFPLLGWLPGFGVVLALAVVALIGWSRLSAPRWVFACLAALALTLLFLVVGLRYRAPIVPLLCALAGAGLVFMVEWISRRAWRQVLTAAVACVITFVIAHARVDAASHNVAEEWSFTGLALLGEGDLTGAEQAYQRAVTLDARASFARDGLGLVAQRRNQPADARIEFERAVSVNPDNALAWHHLGLTFEQSRDLKGAANAYRESLAIAPERTDVVFALGNVLMLEGATSEAEPLLTKAASRGHARAHLSLAMLSLQARDTNKALQRAREAVKYMPTDGIAWEVLARAAAAAGLRREAEEAMITAKRYGRP